MGGREEEGKEGGLLLYRASNISRPGRALNGALTKKIAPPQTLPGTALMHRAAEFGPEAVLQSIGSRKGLVISNVLTQPWPNDVLDSAPLAHVMSSCLSPPPPPSADRPSAVKKPLPIPHLSEKEGNGRKRGEERKETIDI